MSNNAHTQYIDLYGSQRALLDAGSPSVMNDARPAAAEQLTAQGLPASREERYKYTPADEAFAPDFGRFYVMLCDAPLLLIYYIGVQS